jgi:hypothetical protein
MAFSITAQFKAAAGNIPRIFAQIESGAQRMARRVDGALARTQAGLSKAAAVSDPKEFGIGLVQGVRDVWPTFRAVGGAVVWLGGLLGGLFGNEKTSQIRNFARFLGWLAAGFVAVSAAARVATGVKWAYRGAVIAVKGAVWLLKGAFNAGKQSIDMFARAFSKSSDSIAKGSSSISTATTKMGKFQDAAGAATLALGAWALAWEANDSLKEHTQGLGAWDIAKGMWEQGTWDPAKVVDRHQNALAQAAAAARGDQTMSGGDTIGNLDRVLGGVERQLEQMRAGELDVAGVESIRRTLAAAGASVPQISLDADAATAAARAQERIDSLTASLDALATGAGVLPPDAPMFGVSSPNASMPGVAPAVVAPPQLSLPREQSETMARMIGAEVRRAMKETPINVTVEGATGSSSSADAPRTRAGGVRVSDSGRM